MTGPAMKEDEGLIIPRLAPGMELQLGLQNVMESIAGLQQYAGTVLSADMAARLRDVAARMKQSSAKAENYNAAWFGEQALRAIGQNRLDLAAFAINIGLGGSMSMLSDAEKKQISGIITRDIQPEEGVLNRLIVRLEIASTLAAGDNAKKDFGLPAASRINRAADEAQKRLDKGDMEGAGRLISMDRAYMGFLMAYKGAKWAGRAEMEDALALETASKDGSARFNGSLNIYQFEAQRDNIRQQLQYLGQSMERMDDQNAVLDKNSQFMARQRIAPIESKLALMGKWLESMTSLADFEKTGLVKGRNAPSFMDEFAALLADTEAETRISGLSAYISRQTAVNQQDMRRAGGDRETLSWMQKADAGFQSAQDALQAGNFNDAKKAFTAAMEAKTMALAFYSTPAKAERSRWDDVEMFMLPKLARFKSGATELFDLLYSRPLDLEAVRTKADNLERAMLLTNTTMMCIPPRANYTREQGEVLRLIERGKLDDADAAMRKMEQAAKDYIRVMNGIITAGGIGAWFIPYVGPVVSTGVFASMATDNIVTEYRATGHVSVQSWVWAGMSVLPGIGLAGKSVQFIKSSTGVVMAGATAYSAGNTFMLYNAALKETDPYRRHELMSDAMYSMIFLAPAALMVPKGYSYAKGVVQDFGYALQDMMPLPSKAQAQLALQPLYVVGYGAKRIPIVRTPTGALVEGTAPPPIALTAEELQNLVHPPNFLSKTIGSIKERRERVAASRQRSEPPSVEEFSASTGRIIAEVMDKAPGNIVEMARAVYRAAQEAKGKDDAGYWSVLRRCVSNSEVRGQLIILAQTDPEIAALLRFTDATIAQAAKNAKTSPKLVMNSLASQTRMQGMPPHEALMVIEALEREGLRQRKPTLQHTHDILGIEISASDHTALLLNFEGKTTKVGKKVVPVVSADDVLKENFALTQQITTELNKIKPGNDPLLQAFKQDLMAEAGSAKDFDSAVLAALKGKNFAAAMEETGPESVDKLNEAVKGGNMKDVKAALPDRIRNLIEVMDEKSNVRDYMLAAAKLGPRVSDITNGVHAQAGGLAAGSHAKTVFGALWDWTRDITATRVWPAIKFIEWGYGGAIMKALPGTRLRAAFRGSNILPLIVQGAAWYVEGKAAWDYGIHPLYNTLTQAGTVEEGRKAAYDRFVVNISRENAIFARSDEGKEFMLYIPSMFPKGSERRPSTEAEVRTLLERNDIIFEMGRMDDALSDGRQMSVALPRINSLLASGNDAQLQTLLGGMGISLADAKAALAKSGKKELDIRDMADLRMNDWAERGVAYRFRNVVANTLCYDLGMDEATAKKDARFLAENTDAFLVLWNEFQNGNLPGVWLESAIDALSAAGVMESLRSGKDLRSAMIARLQEHGAYLKIPIRSDSFLAVLDERPYGMPGARAADATFKAGFKTLLDSYRDNPQALARFNAFTINAGEDIYGDASRLASIISGSGNPQEVLSTARRIGLVAPAALALKDPDLLKPENADLVKFVVEHSSRDANTFEVNQVNGAYAWFMDNRAHMLNATAILTDLSRNKMAGETGPDRLYTPKNATSYLTGQEQYFQSKGWWTGWAPVRGAKPVKGMKTPPAASETEKATREKEMERRYPRSAQFVPSTEAVATGPTMSDDAAAFYASPVATTLDKLVTGLKLDDAAKSRVYGMLNSTNPRDQAMLRLATIKVEHDRNGAITAVNVQDGAKATDWLKRYLK